jgi:hypothetical protein
MSTCPACSELATPPSGRKNAPYLLVFTKPYEQVSSWRDNKTTGLDVLRKELAKAGLDLVSDFRIASLWLHEPGKNDECYNAGRDLVLEESKGRKVVVLVGSDATEEFCGMSAGDVAGLQVDAPAFSAPIVFVLPKPEGVFVRGYGIGELRLSCQKLAKALENE